MRVPAQLVVLLVLTLPAVAAGQDSWTYRVRFEAEQRSTRSNEDSPVRQPQRWQSGQLVVLSGDAGWEPHARLRFGGSASVVANGAGHVEGRLREGYGRGSLAPWLDVEAGRRIVRWGVGYGFAPAGVLDPVRDPTDPTDRMQLNAGRAMVKADLYRGEGTITLGATADLGAIRVARVLPGGMEIGLIAAAGSDAAPRYAGTATQVIGQQLELHGEVLSHQHAGERTVSASLGLQYTFTAGINVVVEYHRNGHGLTDDQWNAVRTGQSPPGSSVARRNALFTRIARAGHDRVVSPEAIVILSPDDGTRTVIPSITWTPRGHLQLYARATRLWGGGTSLAGVAPWTATLSAGGIVRF